MAHPGWDVHFVCAVYELPDCVSGQWWAKVSGYAQTVHDPMRLFSLSQETYAKLMSARVALWL